MMVIGLILAGGSGSRLGQVDKAQLRLGGKTLIERVFRRLEGAGQVLISTGLGDANLDAYGPCLTDLDLPVAGPLAGLAAATNHLSASAGGDTIVVSVAVDTPFLPADYVARLAETLNRGHAAAQAGWQRNAYPTNAAWRLSDIADLPKRLAAGEDVRSPKQLLRQLSAPLVDWSDTEGEDPFANLNTLEDLVALARRSAPSRL